jgi:HEAT repeat protein
MPRILPVLIALSATLALAQSPTPSPTAATGEEHVQYWVRTIAAHPMKLTRKNAARVLGTLGDRKATPALIAALKDPFFGVRVEAAKALGLLTDEGGIEGLTEAANSDADAQVRRNARDALEKIKAYQEFQRKKQEKLK